YLKNAWTAQQAAGQAGEAGLLDAIREGAVQRVRPKAMTVAVIVAGLLSLFVVPAAYWLMRRRAAREAANPEP
ncbi:MAG: hypothetical protein Q8L71_07825, partial [Thiobacillus sp.]|nr:hypothetical protein [Thiobacillus sp.]